MLKGSAISTSKRTLKGCLCVPLFANDEPTCFIACPFDPDSLQIADTIKAELSDRFNVVRLDQQQDGNKFYEKVIESIHQADVIVALVNKPEEDKANPNVLYEIGLAHALGKPVIAVTDKPPCVPANIRSYEYVEYSRSTKDFRELLAQRIKTCINNVDYRVFRPLWPGSYASRRDFRAVLASLLEATAVCNAALNFFHATASGHTDTLSVHAIKMAYNIDFSDSFKDFKENYDDYQNFFRKRAGSSLKQYISETTSAARDVLSSLLQPSDSREATLLVNLRQTIYQIDSYRERLLELHDRYGKFVDPFISSDHPERHERRETIYAETKRLQAAYKQPIIELTRYMDDIARLFGSFVTERDDGA